MLHRGIQSRVWLGCERFHSGIRYMYRTEKMLDVIIAYDADFLFLNFMLSVSIPAARPRHPRHRSVPWSPTAYAERAHALPRAVSRPLNPWQHIRELENLLERAVILTRKSILYMPLAELQAPEEEARPALANQRLHRLFRNRVDRLLPIRRLCAATKCRTRTGMSATRSRKRGAKIGNTFRR
jgi:hypothetical protein